jgi:hypothetical protein
MIGEDMPARVMPARNDPSFWNALLPPKRRGASAFVRRARREAQAESPNGDHAKTRKALLYRVLESAGPPV